jgi:anti-sigma B factor antagonist
MILAVQKKSPSASVGVLELHGRLLMGNDSRQVEWSVDEWIKAGVKSIVLDLRGLDMMDSTGVGIIVMCHAKLEKAGGSMRIAGARGIVQEILHMTHVDRIVKFFATAEEASQNFATLEK